eukprot:997316_1
MTSNDLKQPLMTDKMDKADDPIQLHIEEKDMESSPSNKETVVVTGASGFIASWSIKYLCEKGYRVIGTVRGDPTDDKYQWILDLHSSNAISLANADLLTDGSYNSVIKDADFVLHIACPYVMEVQDAQKDLIEPAVNGTLNVLNACLKATRLKKVVVTSSMAAMTDAPVKKYTEQDWNESSSPSRNAYFYSKTAAERAAWDLYKKEQPNWAMCSINPWMVFGPQLNAHHLNTSNSMLMQVINGMFPVRMNMGFGVVDVRDVASALILVMEHVKAEGRHIVCAESVHWNDIYDCLDEICNANGIESHVPSCPCDCACCCCFVHCIACCQPKGVGDYLHSAINTMPDFDNSKIVGLGMTFRTWQETMHDVTIWLAKHGFIVQIQTDEATPLKSNK